MKSKTMRLLPHERQTILAMRGNLAAERNYLKAAMTAYFRRLNAKPKKARKP